MPMPNYRCNAAAPVPPLRTKSRSGGPRFVGRVWNRSSRFYSLRVVQVKLFNFDRIRRKYMQHLYLKQVYYKNIFNDLFNNINYIL
jgi:hypothetical protein